jgi:hypothetical protein
VYLFQSDFRSVDKCENILFIFVVVSKNILEYFSLSPPNLNILSLLISY